jgi:hypothetical protein
MKLSQAAQETLYRLNAATGYANAPGMAELEALGLVETGKSRFGHWARITTAGRSKLDPSFKPPQEAPGPAQAGTSWPEAPSGMGLIGAQQARGTKPAIPPPAVALDVGALIPVLLRRITIRIIHGKSQGKNTGRGRTG